MARPRLFVALAFAQAVGAWSLAAGTLQARPMDPRPSPGFQQEQRPAGRADSVTSGLRIQTLEGVHLGSDSVTLVPEVRGEAGAMHRFLFGDLNRDLWTLPITLPVLDLDAVAGGLVPDTAGTAEDTTALRLAGEDGVSYRFHPLFGPVESSIPRPLRRSPVEDVLQDQMAARFPLSRLVVSELMRAAGIPVPHARPVVLPHDPRLGRFAGRTGWFEVALDGREGERRPDPGGLGRARREPPPLRASPLTTGEILERLRRDPRTRVDARAVLRVRLLDLLVGDWDVREERWRWVRTAAEDADSAGRWIPIPLDREWALSRIDGLLPSLTSVYFPRYVGFEPEYGEVMKMAWSGQRIDRTLLPFLEREDFRSVAHDLRRTLNDSTLAAAVRTLPTPYVRAAGEELERALRSRRDGLPALAEEYYQLLAGWVDVWGTEAADSVLVELTGPEQMRVRSFAPGGAVRFDRTFSAGETEEVRLYLFGGDDRVFIDGSRDVPVRLRIVGGPGDDRYVDHTEGDHVLLYDDEGRNRVAVGEDVLRTDDVLLVQDSLRTAEAIWESRDWGVAWVPRPQASWDSDVGLYLGAGIERYAFGFGIRPYRSRFSASVRNGLAPDEWIVDLDLERALGSGGWRGATHFELFSRKPTWFFGFEGEPVPDGEEEDFRSVRSWMSMGAELRFVADATWRASGGMTLSHAGPVEPGGRLFDERNPYGAAEFTDLGVHLGLEFDTRDHWSLPTRGFRGDLEVRLHPAMLDTRETFGGVEASVLGITSIGPLAFQSALHARVVGEVLWGRAPYHRLASLGGSSTLPGYVLQRFLGHSLASGAGVVRARVAQVHLVSDLLVGLHGIATTGRVWSEGPMRDRWHSGFGGGVWLHVPSLERTLSFTTVWGEGAPRSYLGFGPIL